MSKKERWIYWLIGAGCGMVISGVSVTYMGLKLQASYQEEKTQVELSEVTKAPQEQVTDLPEVVTDLPEIEAPTTTTESINPTESTNKTEATDNSTTTPSQEGDLIEELLQGVLPGEEETVQENVEAEDTINVFLEEDLSATQICNALEDAGVIASSKALLDYIYEQEKSTKLRTGEFKFPRNASNEVALSILLNQYY